MCGITGFFHQNNTELPLSALNAMRDTLAHRGPDAKGSTLIGNCGLAHRRLSIIDLTSEANQPMQTENSNFTLVFNGEVYNYKEIKKTLLEKGVDFKTNSDTEVVLKAYQFWGSNCLDKFNGFFAFAIYDNQKNELFLARDRIGIKPLFYYYYSGNFAFASELKAIYKYPGYQKVINKKALSEVINFHSITGPNSIFENTFSLPPGHYLKIPKGELSISEYWTVPKPSNNNLSFKENVNKSLQMIKKSVNDRQIADVPLGAFLSGGIDSSLVVALITQQNKKLDTFSIGFESKEFNEAPFAKEVALYLGTNHHEEIITTEKAKNIVTRIPDYFDEPFADPSSISTFFVSELASKNVKVALSGDGGDELFWGYNRYELAIKLSTYLKKVPNFLKPLLAYSIKYLPIASHKRLLQFLNLTISKRDLRYFALWSFTNFTEITIKRMLETDKESYKSFLLLSEKYNYKKLEILPILDIKNFLPNDILTKVDRTSMANSLEVRVPLLDHEIVEFSTTIPIEHKRNNNVSKSILKEILNGLIPSKLVNRPKKGFEIPVREWLLGDLNYLIQDNLNSTYLKEQGIFNASEIDTQLKVFYSGKYNNNWGVWSLVMFQIWYKRWAN